MQVTNLAPPKPSYLGGLNSLQRISRNCTDLQKGDVVPKLNKQI